MFRLWNKSKESSAETSPTQKKSWLGSLQQGLAKSSSKLSTQIADLFTKRRLDKEAIEHLEEILISADVGVNAATALCQKLAEEKFEKDISGEEVQDFLAEMIGDMLLAYERPLLFSSEKKPVVILVCGVNGTGKTTSIGKLAAQWIKEGNKVMVVGCDTFRAAAVEQLGVWAERAGSIFFSGEEQQDPASVAYQALEKAKEEKVDIVLIDTAGRLHNKKGLMDELAKLVRVIKKVDETAPHHTVLVLDATTGQNALQQARVFQEVSHITGLIVTKLDGTARGGALIGLVQECKLPVHYIGVGEAIDDLQQFKAVAFAKALLGIEKMGDG